MKSENRFPILYFNTKAIKIPATTLELWNETLQKSLSFQVLRKIYDMPRKGHWSSKLVSFCSTISQSNIF